MPISLTIIGLHATGPCTRLRNGCRADPTQIEIPVPGTLSAYDFTGNLARLGDYSVSTIDECGNAWLATQSATAAGPNNASWDTTIISAASATGACVCALACV